MATLDRSEGKERLIRDISNRYVAKSWRGSAKSSSQPFDAPSRYGATSNGLARWPIVALVIDVVNFVCRRR